MVFSTTSPHKELFSKISFGSLIQKLIKAYRVFNSRTLVVKKSIHVKFNDGLTSYKRLLEFAEDFANLHIELFDKLANAHEPLNARAMQ
ncbi:hypothetical protein CR513_29309, partial [Mucuna pruriens]